MDNYEKSRIFNFFGKDIAISDAICYNIGRIYGQRVDLVLFLTCVVEKNGKSAREANSRFVP